ncbi:MAG TPA: hypothetical protein VIZ58_04165 [Thermoanaerobaculia bacterium]
MRDAWLKSSFIERGDPIEVGQPPPDLVEVLSVQRGKSRVGRWPQSPGVTDTVGPELKTIGPTVFGPSTTFWPVRTQVRATVHKYVSLLKPAESQVVERPYTAYLFQEKDGSWKAPMQRPKDETPVYKVW